MHDRRMLALLIGLAGLCATAQAGEMKQYETRYYLIQTDLDEEGVREARLRVDLLFEAYLKHTSGFTGVMTQKLPILIFTNKSDYAKAAGSFNSSGLYTGQALLVHSERQANQRTWHIVQHEAFHQFVDRRIGGGLPTWANEGLAEYFGSAVFTGEDYIAGVLEEDWAKDVQYKLRGKRYKSVAELMDVTGGGWHEDMKVGNRARRNYRQAWSLVYFLLHAEDGRYRAAFTTVMQQAGAGRPWSKAWEAHIPLTADELEEQWRTYWLELDLAETKTATIEAKTHIFLNYLALATRNGQRFRSAQDFFSKAQARAIAMTDDDWLPPELIKDEIAEATRLGRWRLKMSRRGVELSCKPNRGRAVTGEFAIDDGVFGENIVMVQGEGNESRRTRRARP